MNAIAWSALALLSLSMPLSAAQAGPDETVEIQRDDQGRPTGWQGGVPVEGGNSLGLHGVSIGHIEYQGQGMNVAHVVINDERIDSDPPNTHIAVEPSGAVTVTVTRPDGPAGIVTSYRPGGGQGAAATITIARHSHLFAQPDTLITTTIRPDGHTDQVTTSPGAPTTTLAVQPNGSYTLHADGEPFQNAQGQTVIPQILMEEGFFGTLVRPPAPAPAGGAARPGAPQAAPPRPAGRQG